MPEFGENQDFLFYIEVLNQYRWDIEINAESNPQQAIYMTNRVLNANTLHKALFDTKRKHLRIYFLKRRKI